MKKVVLALVLAAVGFPIPAFAAGSPEEVRAAGDLSFDYILNKLTDEYSKGLLMPAPAAAPDEALPPAS